MILSRRFGVRRVGSAALLIGWAWCAATWIAAPAVAQTGTPPAPPATPVAGETGVRWQQMTPAQRTALQPLEREWPGIDPARKQKWLELSSRVPSMTADERARIQTRMTDWAKLTPLERARARLNFEEAKELPSKDRQARWEAYQALPPEQKRQLAERAVPPDAARRSTTVPPPPGAPGREVPQAKSNIVPNPALAAPPRPIAPTVIQAQPGATTNLIGKRALPPAHQQTGLPKIAATPEFVDRSTLLPQRGPQGAAARPSATPEASPGARPRR